MAESALVLGLVGLGALGAASLSGSLSSGSKKSEGIVARTQFASSLGILLNSDLGCDKIKGLGGGSGSFSDRPTPIEISGWNYQGISTIKGGYDQDGKPLTKMPSFEIEALQAFYDSPIDPAVDPSVKTTAGADSAYKKVLKVRADLKVGNKSQSYFYNIPVLANASGVVTLCSDKKSLAETCATIRGTYNESTNTCNLDTSCRIKGTYSTLSCSGTVQRNSSSWTPVRSPQDCQKLYGDAVPNQMTSDFRCPAGSRAELTHSSSWTYTKNQKRSGANVNNTMTWYNCMECPP